MSKEERKIVGNNIDPELEKLFEATSNLVVPPSKLGKEAAWDKLMQTIEQEEVNETKVVKFSYAKIIYSIAAVIIVFMTIATLTYRFAQVKVVSPKGEIALSILPDGSELKLNADSEIEYRKYGWLSNRVVNLSGEGYFNVKNGNSFIVNAGVDRRVTVTGTEFNVFSRESLFEVKCFEGSVVVETPMKSKISIEKGNGISVKELEVVPIQFNADSISTPTWINGEFFFNNAKLDEVFDEINRQFNVTITTSGFDPQSRVYTGYFQRTDLKQALDLVCLPMGLKYTISSDNKSVNIIFENK
ncbi:MAG: FecR family protein [Tenuifilaceae bacterium]